MANKIPIHLAREAIKKPWVVMPIFLCDSYISRVPEHYKKFFWEWKCAPKTPVHYIPQTGKFEKLPNGVIQTIQDVPLPLLQPKQLHEGIWGGEAIVKGFLKKKPTAKRFPRYWVPTIKSSVVHSEILDRYMKVVVTERTLQLIDKHYGFDNYILETSPADLMSELALRLRREMLLALVQGTLYPDNPSKREEILGKYQKHIIPEEEAEWYGLTLKEAATKQKIIEEDANRPQPLKHTFRKEYVEYLMSKKEEEAITKESESPLSNKWLSRVNPFGKK